MKLLKPDWIHHDGKPIFSVDVHPDGTKFATGGHGNDAGRVTIWNMRPVLTEAAAADPGCARILCQLDQHAGCVNCVRWSGSGQLLASGGDDKVVMVWKRGKGPSAVFGNGGLQKVAESWRCAATLRGHEGDVLDVGWSAGDRWLATCSVDNTIMVWDVAALQQQGPGGANGGGGGGGGTTAPRAAWLRGHTGLVKGIAWDPVGKFLASQSDDRTVRIWRTADWSCQTTLTEPFEECGGTTHVLRLSWSPDGLYLVSAHAMNGGGPTAQIIERENFKCDKDFVGHRKAVTCVRFHSAILRRQAPHATNKWQQYCCLAIGSRDRSVSVWMTALQRPLVVVHELFADSVLDLSWSPVHNILMASSNDGTVAALQFDAAELGTPLTAQTRDSLYRRMYGQSVEQTVDLNATQDGEVIIEYAELLNSAEEKQPAAEKPATLTNGNAMAKGMSVGEKDGAGEQQQQPELSARLIFSAAMEAARPITPVKPAICKQFETRAKDGRRRITPMFIPLDQETCEYTSSEASSSHPPTTSTEIVPNAPITSSSAQQQSQQQQQTTEPKPPSPQQQKPKQSQHTAGLDSRLAKSLPGKTAAITATGSAPDLQQRSATNANAISTSNSTTANHSADRQLVFTAGRASAFRGTHSKTTGSIRLSVANDALPTSLGAITKVTANTASQSAANAKPLWEQLIGSPVVNFAVCSRWSLLCSLDGTVRVLDVQTGVPTLPLVQLPTPAVQCCFSPNSELAGCITETGCVRVWRLHPAPARIHCNTVCTDVLSGGYVTHFHCTDAGVVFVVLANGCAYSYCPRLESWLVVSSRDPVIRSGAGTTHLPNAIAIARNPHEFPLNTVQTIAANAAPQTHHRQTNNNNNHAWQPHARLAYIEHQLRLSESVGTAAELEHWYVRLGSHLADHGPERRLRLLLDELMGVPPALRNGGGSGGASEAKRARLEPEPDRYLGLVRSKLLQIVLDRLQSAPRWQRIFMEYSEQLIERQADAAQADGDEPMELPKPVV